MYALLDYSAAQTTPFTGADLDPLNTDRAREDGSHA